MCASTRFRSRRLFALGFALAAFALLLPAAGCERQSEPSPPPALPVHVVRVAPQTIPIVREHPGRTVAVNTVDVRARVAGTLEKALFQEGADVHKGDLLFVIEQAPYRAALAEAQGALARARASAAKVEADWKRVQALFDQNVASASRRDAAKAALEEAQADVQSRAAALEQARLDLGYTEVHAPIDGRVGRIQVDVGNLVGAGQDTILTTLVQLDPIYVTFNPPEQERLDVIKGREAGRYVPRDEIQVHLSLADGTAYPEVGHIDFVDNTVDPSAGTVQVRAVFPNPDEILLPGEYANVSVTLGRREALLVPERAVIEEQGSTRVLVAGDGDVVESRSVDAEGTYQRQRIIAAGLSAGDRVLVDNLQRARPGMHVVASEESPGTVAGAPPAPSSAVDP